MRRQERLTKKLPGHKAKTASWRKASEKNHEAERNQVNTASAMKIVPSTRSNCLPNALQEPIS